MPPSKSKSRLRIKVWVGPTQIGEWKGDMKFVKSYEKEEINRILVEIREKVLQEIALNDVRK